MSEIEELIEVIGACPFCGGKLGKATDTYTEDRCNVMGVNGLKCNRCRYTITGGSYAYEEGSLLLANWYYFIYEMQIIRSHLKNCPICGSTPFVELEGKDYSFFRTGSNREINLWTSATWFRCPHCDVGVNVTEEQPSNKTDKWNEFAVTLKSVANNKKARMRKEQKGDKQ